MAYFTKEFIDFLKRLSRNNTREWFHAHKQEYERHVKVPFNDFVDEMIHRVSTDDPEIAIEPKDAIFRIARDIRFSKDKTPYKSHVAAVINRGGKKVDRYPGLYFSFNAQGVWTGGGMYRPDRDDLIKIRRAIKRDGTTLARALQGKQFKELFSELHGEKNKRLPKEFAAVAERFPYVANKQFYYFAEYNDPQVILKRDLADFIMRHYRAGKKVNEFLKAAVA